MKNLLKDFNFKNINLFDKRKKNKWRNFVIILGLIIPNFLIAKNTINYCTFEMDLLVADPVTSGKTSGTSGLEALGLSSKSTDESTLKAVLASRSVTSLLTEQLKNKYKNDREVSTLISKINSSWNIESNNTTLRINTKRGDRFQDLSIIRVSLLGDHSVLKKINKEVINFYENYGPIYKANRTKMATQFANSQIDRLKSEYASANKTLGEIREESFGLDPSYVIELSIRAYQDIEAIKTSAKFDIASNAINAKGKNSFSPIAEEIHKNNLQPIVTSSSFLKILDSYNILKNKYDLLSVTRSQNDREVSSLKENLIILENSFKNKLGDTKFNIEDFPSSEYISELIGEVIRTQKAFSTIKKANEEQEFHSNNLKKSYKLDEDYKFLIAEVGSISATLAAYRDLKEKLLLDAAQDLSSWNVIGSNIKCSYFKFITFLSIYSLLYLFIVLYFENKSIRNLVKDIFIKLKENF